MAWHIWRPGEAITFEAKIEHKDGNEITPYHIGQAHNQLNRALSELQALGYSVTGTLVTHLTLIDPSARSSAGTIRVLQKSAVCELWAHVEVLLRSYANGWSLDDLQARMTLAQALLPKCPSSGWLSRALQSDELFVNHEKLMKEWQTYRPAEAQVLQSNNILRVLRRQQKSL